MAYTFTTGGPDLTTQTWYNEAYSTLGPTSMFVILETSPTLSCSSLPATVTASVATTVTLTASPSSSGSSGFNCTFCGSSNQTNDAHITSPVAAGIGIGSAVVGATIAALFFFFILPSRKSSSESYQQQDFALDERGPAGNEKFDVSTTVTNIKHFVPQPTEDDAMTRDLTTIFVAIKDHIQNYYHITQDQRQIVDEETLNELSRATAIPSRDIVGLLHNSRTGIPTLRLFLACYILSRCTEQSDEAQSFLPDEVLAFKGLNFTGQPSAASKSQ
jgi:hypothetical protein